MPIDPVVPAKRRVRLSPMFLLTVMGVVAALCFCARKLGAQVPPSKGRPAPSSAAAALVADAGAPAAPSPSVEPKDKATAKGGSDKKDGADKKEDDPVDYAVTQEGGGVPVHNEGQFRSPFAHPRFGTPVNVRAGFLLANLRDFEILKGTFTADFYFTYTSDRPMPKMDPNFTNGKVDLKEVMVDKPTFKMYHFIGSFSSPLDLHDYPFDTQELTIEIEDNDNGTDQLKIVADPKHTSLDIGFEVPGWETSYLSGKVVTHNFPDRFDNDDLYYERYEFALGIRRYGVSAVFTVFVPAIVIVMISLSGLWLPKEELEVRTNATTPMLAAAVLFHFALMQQLPATAYLTRADKLMMAVYGALGLHMLISWLWFALDERHTERVMNLGKQIGVPLTFAILAAGVFA